MKRLLQNKKSFLLLPMTLVILTGCADFAGLRTPKYDGKTVERDEEAIEQYVQTQQINEENEDHYFRYPLSDTLSEPSLDFTDEETVTLGAGTYLVGEDLPSGRVIFEGHPSNFSAEVFLIFAGNITVYDEEDVVTFENHFQENSGVMQAVADLREGQTVEVEGEDPRIDVHYSEERATSLLQPENENQLSLIAGHYEVGRHLDAGSYTIESVFAPRTPVLYHFTDGDITVVELTQNRGAMPFLTKEENQENFDLGLLTEEEYEQNLELFADQPERPVIELEAGDKLYLPMLQRLDLEKD